MADEWHCIEPVRAAAQREKAELGPVGDVCAALEVGLAARGVSVMHGHDHLWQEPTHHAPSEQAHPLSGHVRHARSRRGRADYAARRGERTQQDERQPDPAARPVATDVAT